MKPLINWEEIQKITSPAMRHMSKKDNAFEKNFASFYNKMASMEKLHTLNQVNALPLQSDDTLLDMGCGPGRLSIPLAQRVKSVTALDISEEVLKYCKINADEAGLTNLATKKLDFKDAVAGSDIEEHDVVVCSRSVGLWNLKKLSTFAKRLTAIITFANAPTIPQLLSNIFKDTVPVKGERPPFTGYGKDRRTNYNVLFNIAYDLGYEPNINIVKDGFTKDYISRKEAYEDIITLGKVDENKMDVYKKNLDKYLIINSDGSVTFFIETRTCVMWWEKQSRKFF